MFVNVVNTDIAHACNINLHSFVDFDGKTTQRVINFINKQSNSNKQINFEQVQLIPKFPHLKSLCCVSRC